MHRAKKLFSLIALILMALSCAVPGVTFPNVGSAVVSETAAVIQPATLTETPGVTPSLTMTFTPTLIYLTPRFPSETPTLPATPGTQTLTLEPTSTFTQTPVVIRVTRPTHCRAGPGTDFEIVGSFLVGMKANVLGRDGSSQFYYIPNPYVFTDYCWVSGKYAEFEGNPVLLPIVTSPPTPTSTGTAAPTLEFKLEGSGFQSCGGAFWMNIEITSESAVPFESVLIETWDRDKNVTRSTAANTFAAAKGCDGLVVEDQVTNGTAVLVSTAKFDYNIKGNTLRAYVTVCAKDDQQGTCTTREVALRP